MGHALRLFAGPLPVLRHYRRLDTRARIYALTPAPMHYVLPVDDDLHDAFHVSYGTGDWVESGPQLSSGDMAFAAKASRGGVLAYLETEFFGGIGTQGAAVWAGGVLVLGPLALEFGQQTRRPASMWPINAALKRIGVVPAAQRDAFETFGLGAYRSIDDVRSRALLVHD